MAAELDNSSSTSSSQAAETSDSEALGQQPDDEGVDELRPSLDLPGLAGGSKGSGPRLFCGHVPKEVNDEMVRQHFAKWGTVSDVYFPRHKKTLKRRPFCFVTFASKEDAERALQESGLEIGGVAIKNLTMVEDRDKYYTNKHASARQALLQALKQLGPSSAAPAHGAPAAATAAAAAALPAGASGVTAEQLSNLAAIMALEGVHSDVVLQTLGLPTTAEAAAAAAPGGASPMPGLTASSLASLDGATLLQALASPALSSQTAFDMRGGSFDMRGGSFDMRGGSFDLSSAMRSAGNSMDLSSLQHSLAAAAAATAPLDAASVAGRMHAADSRSTLASADWSRAPSARTSLDAMLMPAATAGFLASHGQLAGMGGMQTRLSLDAALQLQHAQQQAAAAHAHQAAMLAHTARLHQGAYPQPQAAPQANLSSVMHSGFYQAQASPPQPEVQHSLDAVMTSGLYGAAPGAPPPARHSMHEFSGTGGSLLPFADATWAPQPAPQHHVQQMGGYSTAMRPSIDRGGLPPLPPRSPNQDGMGRPSTGGSPDLMMGMPAGGWPAPGRVAV